jgi:hypothetical protein
VLSIMFFPRMCCQSRFPRICCQSGFIPRMCCQAYFFTRMCCQSIVLPEGAVNRVFRRVCCQSGFVFPECTANHGFFQNVLSIMLFYPRMCWILVFHRISWQWCVFLDVLSVIFFPEYQSCFFPEFAANHVFCSRICCQPCFPENMQLIMFFS